MHMALVLEIFFNANVMVIKMRTSSQYRSKKFISPNIKEDFEVVTKRMRVFVWEAVMRINSVMRI